MNEEKKFLVMNVVNEEVYLDIVNASDVYDAIAQSTFQYDGADNVSVPSVYELKEDLAEGLVKG